ncbi:hypothetical protein D3C76_1298530 [compost metagenome]
MLQPVRRAALRQLHQPLDPKYIAGQHLQPATQALGIERQVALPQPAAEHLAMIAIGHPCQRFHGARLKLQIGVEPQRIRQLRLHAFVDPRAQTQRLAQRPQL